MPYLNEIIGKGFRLDHEPTLLTMDAGTEGVSAPTPPPCTLRAQQADQGRGARVGSQHVLHGSSGPEFDPYQYYVHKNGHMHAGLTVVAFQVRSRPLLSRLFSLSVWRC